MFTGMVIERFLTMGLACVLVLRNLRFPSASVASDGGPTEVALVSNASFLLLTNPVLALPKPRHVLSKKNKVIITIPLIIAIK